MARYNEILVGRYNRALQKLMGMKGAPPSPQLGTEVMPVIPFEDSESVELRYLNSWSRFMLWLGSAAIVGQLGGIQLRNPAGSNVIAVIEKLIVTGANTDTPFLQLIYPAAADLANLSTRNGLLDSRWKGGRAGIFSQGQTADYGAAAQFTYRMTLNPLGADTIFPDFVNTENQEIVLLPDTSFQIRNGVVNLGIQALVAWRERNLDEAELK